MNITGIVIYRKLLQSTDPDPFDGISGTSPGDPRSAAARRPLKSTAPFDSSMALTILVLLTVLFFMCFFSAYIRSFSADDDHPPTPSSRLPRKNRKGGLDPSAVKSLPLLPYGKAAKHPMIDDCPICLSEFQERECVKLIPYCGHVFHPDCADTWLSSHVTCPLCRSAQLFKRAEEACLDVARDKDDIGVTEVGEGSNGGYGDTWRDRETGGVRRTSSCSDLANQSVMQRAQAAD